MEQSSQAVVGPLDGRVMALAQRFALLAEAYREDYGCELSDGLMQRVRWYCSTKPEPKSVGASEGRICVTWQQGAETVSVEFQESGGSVWAATDGARRTWGEGYPTESAWACLRHNPPVTGAGQASGRAAR